MIPDRIPNYNKSIHNARSLSLPRIQCAISNSSRFLQAPNRIPIVPFNFFNAWIFFLISFPYSNHGSDSPRINQQNHHIHGLYRLIVQAKNLMCVWYAAKALVHRVRLTHIGGYILARNPINVKFVGNDLQPARIYTIIGWHILR